MCQKYDYNEETGGITLFRGKPLERLVQLGGANLAICRRPEGLDNICAKGTPENPKTLWPQNEDALQHYRECKAVGQFPDDPIVRRNAAIIEEVEKDFARYHTQSSENQRFAALVKMMSGN